MSSILLICLSLGVGALVAMAASAYMFVLTIRNYERRILVMRTENADVKKTIDVWSRECKLPPSRSQRAIIAQDEFNRAVDALRIEMSGKIRETVRRGGHHVTMFIGNGHQDGVLETLGEETEKNPDYSVSWGSRKSPETGNMVKCFTVEWT